MQWTHAHPQQQMHWRYGGGHQVWHFVINFLVVVVVVESVVHLVYNYGNPSPSLSHAALWGHVGRGGVF